MIDCAFNPDKLASPQALRCDSPVTGLAYFRLTTDLKHVNFRTIGFI